MDMWALATAPGHDDQLMKNRDCTGANIMMDARPIFPRGWRYEAGGFAPDGITLLLRIDHPVRYYFISYGLSHQFLPGQTQVVMDWWAGCGCTRAEEISAIRSIASRRVHRWERFLERVFVFPNVFWGSSN
jgi:hypothetical protein